MTELPPGYQRMGSGCGIRGCLFFAVAVFVVLLVAMLVIAVIRFSQPPQGPGQPMSSLQSPVTGDRPLLHGVAPTTGDRRPTTWVEERRG